MSLFSKIELYCNVCGMKIYKEITNIIGKECKVCSIKCLNEYDLIRAHSVMGKEYIKRE